MPNPTVKLRNCTSCCAGIRLSQCANAGGFSLIFSLKFSTSSSSAGAQHHSLTIRSFSAKNSCCASCLVVLDIKVSARNSAPVVHKGWIPRFECGYMTISSGCASANLKILPLNLTGMVSSGDRGRFATSQVALPDRHLASMFCIGGMVFRVRSLNTTYDEGMVIE